MIDSTLSLQELGFRNHFLFVCSVNMLRSPTAEHVARKLGFCADSAGSDQEAALRPLTGEAIDRAQRIVCMEQRHANAVLALRPGRIDDVEVWALPDDYDYCQPALVRAIKQRLALGRVSVLRTGRIPSSGQ